MDGVKVVLVKDRKQRMEKLKPYDIKIMHKTLQRRMEIINNSS